MEPFLFLQGRELDRKEVEPHCDGMMKLFIKSCFHLEICCLNIGASFSLLDPKHKGEVNRIISVLSAYKTGVVADSSTR